MAQNRGKIALAELAEAFGTASRSHDLAPPQPLTAEQVELLRAAQASLRQWAQDHHEALALADELLAVESLYEHDLDPEHVDDYRQYVHQKEQGRAQRKAERKRKAQQEQTRQRLHIVRKAGVE